MVKSKFPAETTIEIEELEDGGCILHFNFSKRDYELVCRYAEAKDLTVEQALQGYVSGLREHLTVLGY